MCDTVEAQSKDLSVDDRKKRTNFSKVYETYLYLSQN